MDDREKMQRQLAEIGARYIKRTVGELDQLQQLLQKLREGDRTAIKSIEHMAHKIHGSGAMFGFDEVSDRARDLEHAAAASANASAPYDALIEALNTHAQALERVTRAVAQREAEQKASH